MRIEISNLHARTDKTHMYSYNQLLFYYFILRSQNGLIKASMCNLLNLSLTVWYFVLLLLSFIVCINRPLSILLRLWVEDAKDYSIRRDKNAQVHNKHTHIMSITQIRGFYSMAIKMCKERSNCHVNVLRFMCNSPVDSPRCSNKIKL